MKTENGLWFLLPI